MFVHGSKAKVYGSGVDLSPYLKSAGPSGEIDTADTSALGSVDKTFIQGLLGGDFSLDGMFDASATSPQTDASKIEDVLRNVLGVSDLVITHAIQGDSFGAPAYIVQGVESGVEVSSPVTDVVSISGAITADVGLNRGLILQPAGNVAVGGNTASIDNGAGPPAFTSKGGIGGLQVFAISGAGANTLTVKVQHSVDNSVWVDLVTFTAQTAGEKAQTVRLADTAQVNRYVRGLWTLSAGTANFSLAFCRNP